MMNLKKLIWMFFMILIGTSSVYSQANLVVKDFRIKPGETKDVTIDLDNSVSIRAFQVLVVFPK